MSVIVVPSPEGPAVGSTGGWGLRSMSAMMPLILVPIHDEPVQNGEPRVKELQRYTFGRHACEYAQVINFDINK